LEIVFECPDEDCQRLFIARYFRIHPVMSDVYNLGECVPWEAFDSEFSEAIQKISPDFCEIANQAQKAEHQGWKLVAGPGYRKSLEFLIKDYLCRLRPDDTEKIKKVELGACINSYVANDRVKKMASRAAWLGNDEVHYVRKWVDKDLEDLKKLIELTVHWIQMEELTETVLKEMPEGRK